jgi:hypothetical protein
VVASSRAAPGAPGGHGNWAAGALDAACASAAIQLAGSQASWAKAKPTEGRIGRARQASSPRIVPAGAAGAARRFAATPASGIVGSRSTRIGWQASCAAIGTASTTASGPGITRASRAASGGASRIRPPVAATESANPKSPAYQGSATRSTITAVASAGTPPPRRPRARATSSTMAMAAARTTLA